MSKPFCPISMRRRDWDRDEHRTLKPIHIGREGGKKKWKDKEKKKIKGKKKKSEKNKGRREGEKRKKGKEKKGR